MEVLSEAMNMVRHLYDTDFCELEEVYDASGGGELAKSLNCLLCDLAYNVSRQRELEVGSYDVFKPNDKDDFCDMPKK